MESTNMIFPKISIVTTNLNQKEFLEATIVSVLSQNYPNLEYIVIDGKSNDGSIEIIEKFQDKLSFWCSEKDNGLYHALNKGFGLATGDILMWINSDDMLHQGSLLNVAEIFNTFPQVDWITGINISFDENGRIIGADRAKGFSKYDFYTGNHQWLQQESTAWRRELWEKAGSRLNTDYNYASDFELWVRFFRFAKLYPCDVLIGGFRMRSNNQISLNAINKYEDEVSKIIEQEKLIISSKVRNTIFILKGISITRRILKYSVLLDLGIFTRILNRAERYLLKKPTNRIHINRLTCKFEII